MRLYQKYLFLLLFILLTMIVYFYIQKKEEFIHRIDIVLMNLLNKEIELQKTESFAFSLALAQSETLQMAIETNDTKKATEILQRYTSTLEAFSNSKVHVQILTKDFVIFARNWESLSIGLNVKAFRPDLVDIVKTRKPHLSYEAARRLVLIASIPVIKKGELIGFVEVIQYVDAMKNHFADYDIDLLVLLDDKYEKQAVLLKNNPRIGNTIVVNNDANIHHINYLRRIGLKGLCSHGIHEGEQYVYFSRSILNSNGQNIGSFILVLSQEKVKLLSAFEEEMDTFLTYSRKDLYYSYVSHNPATNPWENASAKELFSLKKSIHPEDKIIVEDTLRKKLDTYTKDELISLLLDNNPDQKSRGDIK